MWQGERGPRVLGGVNFKATLERICATRTHATTRTHMPYVFDYQRCRVTEGDGDTVKQAEKSVDRGGNSEGR